MARLPAARGRRPAQHCPLVVELWWGGFVRFKHLFAIAHSRKKQQFLKKKQNKKAYLSESTSCLKTKKTFSVRFRYIFFCKNKNLLKWFQVMYFGCVALFITTDKSKGEKRLHFYLTRDFFPFFPPFSLLHLLADARQCCNRAAWDSRTSSYINCNKD